MTLYLKKGFEVKPSAAPLCEPPRFSIGGGYLMVADFASAADRDAAYARTVGSQDWLWSADDEIRFSDSTGELAHLFFQVPLEVRREVDDAAAADVRTLNRGGGLLLDPLRNFSLPPTEYSCTTSTGVALSAWYGGGPSPYRERLRLRVAPSFDLVFDDGLLVGWLLEQPERYLVTGWERPGPGAADPALAQLLARYLSYLAEPLVYRITDDADPEVLVELLALEERARALITEGGRAEVLARAIRELIDDRY